ncbi:class IV adenylate cyclase [Desulfonatronospira sp.]|uniref:class IV adenylate cyclase n=1 Tax=Desulfonatronospira sp. TaxID=1962951 RepID=UPI0025C55D31|nr:class IV adenylate cyclase [Desulfonatronospira sp.]
MALETELKYIVSDLAPILERIERLGLSCSHWYFEENLVLDTADGHLRSRDVLLRIRKGHGGKITLKLPVAGSVSSCKQRQEIESGVDDPDGIGIILRHLGFRLCLRYEKFRRICRLGETRICLDILPFGSFVELEGPQESFHGTARELGLDSHQITALSYHELHRDYRREQGLEPVPDFVFEETRKKDLARKLNVKL